MDDRLKSRKFWFTSFWCSMVVLCIIADIINEKNLEYVGQVVTFAGTVTAAYIGIQGWADGKKK